MEYYIGLDVSMKTTSICILDAQGKITFEDVVETDPATIAKAIEGTNLPIETIALESGSISHWLVQKLRSFELPVICIDARKMSKLLSININKTDKNDARLIANALRCNFYSEVIQKEQDLAEIKILLNSRRCLLDTLVKLKNTIRGHFKTFGIRLGAFKHKRFIKEANNCLTDKPEIVVLALTGLLQTFESTLDQLNIIDKKIQEMAKSDADVQLLTTIPGIGIITAFTFKVHVGNPSRFKKSRSVGAYFGMTPTQYSSGETTRIGRISKCGTMEVRTLLNDAAMCMMYCTKSWNRVKAWGLKIKQKKGHKKATMAVGRKLCAVMHRMLVTRKPFEYGEKPKDKLAKAL